MVIGHQKAVINIGLKVIYLSESNKIRKIHKTQFENKLSVVWDKLIADVNGLRNVFDKL
jgi:hypothetical protein